MIILLYFFVLSIFLHRYMMFDCIVHVRIASAFLYFSTTFFLRWYVRIAIMNDTRLNAFNHNIGYMDMNLCRVFETFVRSNPRIRDVN